MNPQRAATANILGALALAVAGQLDTTEVSAGHAGSDTAALSALDQFLDRPNVSRLCSVLGLSHSGTVRLLDRLGALGLVTRRSGVDGRTRAVTLTPQGRRAARRAAQSRAAYLDALLNDLSLSEIRTLHGLLARLMSQVVTSKYGGAWICRRCDLRACGRDEGTCPAANAAAIKYPSTTT
ncbi:MAG: MarR family winged helix-turn-helix transcriptional regulator [Actinomycetota bacterium]|nr:MarR family winged helix-turn-helix transcriptional regulator [Actinomycetota bacterium]